MKRAYHPKSIICALLLAGGVFIPAPSAWGDIYFWTDADGVRHFSNTPPRGEVTATRHSQEIPYDAVGDERNQEDERRYFEQRALQNTHRRLERTERALKENLDRAREAEFRADEWSASYGDDYDDDHSYWGTYFGSDYGGQYDVFDRGRRLERDRRHSRRHRRPPNDRDGKWKGRLHGDDSKEACIRRHKRIGRERLSKRERGVRSGLNRMVRAFPSPYDMGYRPVYPRSSASSYESRRGGHGRRAYGRGGGGFRGGVRARIGF